MSDLVDRVTQAVVGVSLDDFDTTIVEVRKRLAVNDQGVKYATIEGLCVTQLKTLDDRHCPKRVIQMLADQIGQVTAKALAMEIPKNHLAVLACVPLAYLGLYAKVEMVRHGEKVGYTLLKPYQITDVVQLPADPYWIYSVEDGEVMRKKAPQDAEKLIQQARRRGLNASETLDLGIHTDVLSRHYVDAVGSRYDSDWVPGLYLNDDTPKLDWGYLDNADDGWGAASCG